jgi:hypothetical protein
MNDKGGRLTAPSCLSRIDGDYGLDAHYGLGVLASEVNFFSASVP